VADSASESQGSTAAQQLQNEKESVEVDLPCSSVITSEVKSESSENSHPSLQGKGQDGGEVKIDSQDQKEVISAASQDNLDHKDTSTSQGEPGACEIDNGGNLEVK